MNNAQISLEFIVAITIVLLIFLVFYAFYIEKKPEIEKSKDLLKLRHECFRISNALESAITLGDGYTNQLTTNYDVRVDDGSISVIHNNASTVCSYRGDVIFDAFSGKVNISNKNNEIIIENA